MFVGPIGANVMVGEVTDLVRVGARCLAHPDPEELGRSNFLMALAQTRIDCRCRTALTRRVFERDNTVL